MLDPTFDEALLGAAVNGAEIYMPCYDLQALWSITPDLWDVLRTADDRLPLIRQQVLESLFWKRVKQQELFAWELMQPAWLGLVSWGLGPTVACLYSMERVLRQLVKTTDSEPNEIREVVEPTVEGEVAKAVIRRVPKSVSQRWVEAQRFFTEKMLPVDTGANTPWYLV